MPYLVPKIVRNRLRQARSEVDQKESPHRQRWFLHPLLVQTHHLLLLFVGFLATTGEGQDAMRQQREGNIQDNLEKQEEEGVAKSFFLRTIFVRVDPIHDIFSHDEEK